MVSGAWKQVPPWQPQAVLPGRPPPVQGQQPPQALELCPGPHAWEGAGQFPVFQPLTCCVTLNKLLASSTLQSRPVEGATLGEFCSVLPVSLLLGDVFEGPLSSCIC